MPLKRFSLLGLLLLATGTTLRADAPPGSSSARAVWTLATADTRLSVGVNDTQQLCLFDLSNPKAGWNWCPAPAVFPLVSRADSSSERHALSWQYATGTVDPSDGTRVTISFTNAEPALALQSVWHARSGPGPIRHAMFIRNNSSQTVTLYEQESFDLQVQGPEGATRVWSFNDDGSLPDKVGVYREPLTNGYTRVLPVSEEQDYIPFVYLDANGANGLYVGWEWSIGRISITGGSPAHSARLQFGNRDDFRTDLAPGETFEVPPGFIGTYFGDVDDGGNSLRRYLFNYSMPPLLREDLGFPKVQWNAFAPTGQGQGSWIPTERKYYPFIDDIAPLGFEEVVIDVGWWSSYGDPGHIITNPTNWPSGMAAAAKYAHDRQIRFGLYDNEPEDLTTLTGIEERISDVSYLFDAFQADFYRSDSTAGPVMKGSHGGSGRARYPEDAAYWTCKGFYQVIDTLSARIPRFLWECCSGGGRIKDFGVSKRAGRIQNQDRYYPLDARQSFYDSSHVLHPMQIAALDGSWAEWQATGSVFEFRSASMGAAYWHPDAPNGGNGGPVWSPSQKEQIKKAVHTYKTRLRPLIRAGNLYHIFPRPDDVVWDGVEYFDPLRQEGVVYLFKAKSPVDTQTVKLRGLEAKTRYRLTFEDGSNPTVQLPGEALMASGIPVRLPGTNVSELLFIEKEP